jgi:hypothetical protein
VKPGHPIVFSPGPSRLYRYALWREVAPDLGDKYLMVIGLNPSTADETRDDPTIRKCIKFARDWGYSALCMTNLFAFRATDPREMKCQANPIGPDNDYWLRECASHAAMVVAAWGVNGRHLNRDLKVRGLFLPGQLHCIRMTKKTQMPEHPLYLPGALMPIPLP